MLGEGTILNPSIPVFDAWSGDELGRGYVPPWSVAVGAMRRRQYPGGEFFLPCVLVVRHLTPGERHDKAHAERDPPRARGLGVSSSGADLLELTAELVDIPSVSHDEAKAADFVVEALGGADHLEITRIGNNVVARTSLGRARRLLIAGHLDTVPPNGNERAVIDDDRCAGLGSADMKGGVAVMIELAGQRRPSRRST